MKIYLSIILSLLPTILLSKEIGFDTEAYIAKGVCPFECCTYRDWYSRYEITLYEHPSLSSKIIIKIPKNTKVIALTGEVHLNPSRFVFNKEHWLGYKANDVIWILNNLGEGEYQAWDGKKIVGVVFFDHNSY